MRTFFPPVLTLCKKKKKSVYFFQYYHSKRALSFSSLMGSTVALHSQSLSLKKKNVSQTSVLEETQMKA